jgi:hypothetical protein
MRIEHQGTVEVQPVYQHVGYLSSAYDQAYLAQTGRASPAPFMGTATLMLAAALMVGRGRGAWAKAAGAVLAVGAVAAGLAGGVQARKPTEVLVPEFYHTLQNLELACAATERMQQRLGRPPTPAEWRLHMRGRPYALDGWGHPFLYQDGLHVPRMCDDNQPYRVTSVPERMRATLGYVPTDREVWEISSDMLGRDGVFGTMDDYLVLSYKLRETHWDPAEYPNLRAPRVVKEGNR